MRLEPLRPAFGLELHDLDPAHASALEAADLPSLLARHGVLLLRDRPMTPEAQIAFSRNFGALESHAAYPAALRHPQHDELLVVKRYQVEGRALRFGGQWHSDLSYTLAPSKASVLHALVVPPSGGDTLFADLAGAYAALPDAARERLEGLWVVHDLANGRQYGDSPPDAIAAMRAKSPPVEQPLVRRHPETGRPSLFISEWMTRRVVGMSEADSRALLEPLLAHTQDPAFLYRHRWRVGDTLIWDNRSTNHLAMGDYEGERVLHRCSLLGEPCGRPARPAA
ncbi:MAG: TauD/TfdA family dioxygenase [Tistlia sp.]|uniref:TauD/TfdA dioxygenase family protein n=1 Tax=Tistlia sp. TaxID=3057121 RepID=UPI0034A366C3